jgi:hypothetical protein
MFEECVCFKCAYKNVNASIRLVQPVCECEYGFLASNIKRMKIHIVKLLTFQRFKGLFTPGFIASCKHNSNTLLRQLADNLQAYPFVCSCHHCHCVFGPPPETISLSKALQETAQLRENIQEKVVTVNCKSEDHTLEKFFRSNEDCSKNPSA